MRTIFPSPKEVRRTLGKLNKLRKYESFNGHKTTGFQAERHRLEALGYKEFY